MQLSLFGDNTPFADTLVVPVVEHKSLAAALSDLTEIESDEIKQPKNFKFVCPQVGTPAFRLLTKYRALGSRILWRLSADFYTYTEADEMLLEEVQTRYFKSIEKLIVDENNFDNIAYLQEEYADVVASTLDDIIRGELEWHKPLKQLECCHRSREGVYNLNYTSAPRNPIMDVEETLTTVIEDGKEVVYSSVKWKKKHSTGEKAVFDKNGKIVRWEKSRGVEIR